MKNLLSLAVVAGFVAATFGIAAPAHADEFVSRYTYLVNGAQVLPSTQTTVLTQPAVIDSGACGTQVLTQPALINNSCGTQVLTQPAIVGTGNAIMVQDHENLVPHFFHGPHDPVAQEREHGIEREPALGLEPIGQIRDLLADREPVDQYVVRDLELGLPHHAIERFDQLVNREARERRDLVDIDALGHGIFRW